MVAEVAASNITVRPAELHIPNQVLEIGLGESTPNDVIDWLTEQGIIRKTTPGGQPLPPYRLALGNDFLAPDVPLAKSGVRPEDELVLHGGMDKGARA